jgi:hypothetical protein
MAIALMVIKGFWSFLKAIPWQIWAIIAIVLTAWWGYNKVYNDGYVVGKDEIQVLWDADKLRMEHESEALLKKIELEYAAIEAENARQLARATERFNAEIARIKSNVGYLRGLRLGPGVCNPATSTTEGEVASNNNGASPRAWVLSEKTSRDLEELMFKAEHAAAIARTCQSFLHEQEQENPPEQVKTTEDILPKTPPYFNAVVSNFRIVAIDGSPEATVARYREVVE